VFERKRAKDTQSVREASVLGGKCVWKRESKRT